MSDLETLAAAHGVATLWYDIAGRAHRPPPTTLAAILAGLGVDPDAPGAPALPRPLLVEPERELVVPDLVVGQRYHVVLDTGERVEAFARASAEGGAVIGGLPMGLHHVEAEGVERFVLAAPTRCLTPAQLGVGRGFGISSQLYGLRTQRGSEIGDFADLAVGVRAAGEAGADVFGLSPLHALFMADSAAISPYSPSHRRFLNPLFVAVPEAAHRLSLPVVAAPRSAGSELLDYPSLATAKRAALEALWRPFRDAGGSPAFDRFRLDGGVALERHCRFEALHEAVLAEDPKRWGFWCWPHGWDQPDSPSVQSFADAHAERVSFFAFLQWLADLQLADVQATARHAGMRLGLYRDLAVGVSGAGSMAWSTPGLTLRGLSIGAPPDPLGPDGQKWGLAPFAPTALARLGYRPLLDDLEANARHAGAVRIDHVLGFARQFWIPDEAPAAAGTYVDFPFEVLTRLCALVSHRQRCLFIGEDLGTVPEGFRERLNEAGLLSCRVLWFEREGQRFRSPSEYPKAALASVSTHDLPTVEGFWRGRDVSWRADLAGDDDRRAAGLGQREGDKAALVAAIRQAGIDDEDVVVALHRFLARSTSALVLIQLEDLAAMVEQANLPGTTVEHPNWRRRLPAAVEDLFAEPRARRILAAVRAERPRD